MKFKNIVEIKTGKLNANASDEDGKYPFYTCADEPLKINTVIGDYECLLLVGNGANTGKVFYNNGPFNAYQRTYILKPFNSQESRFIYWFLRSKTNFLLSRSVGSATNYIKLGDIENLEYPNTSNLDVEKISSVFERLQKVITYRKYQINKFDELIKARFVELFGDAVHNDRGWETCSVEEACSEIYGGGTPSKAHSEYYEDGDIPWVSSKDMKSDVIYGSQIYINQLGVDNSTAKIVPINSVIMVIRSGILKHTLPVAINAVPITVNQDLKVFIPSERILTRFMAIQFKMHEKDILAGVRAVTADNIEFNTLKQRLIIIPPIDLQLKFVDFCEQVDKSKFINLKQKNQSYEIGVIR